MYSDVSSPESPELTLELGGDLDRQLNLLATDGVFGYPAMQSSSITVLKFQHAEMKEVCDGIIANLRQQEDFTSINLLVVAGTKNFEMENKIIGGKMPITYLRKNYRQVKSKLINSVISPLQELVQYLQTRKGRLVISSIMPSHEMVHMNSSWYRDLLDDSLTATNNLIHKLNASNGQDTLQLAEAHWTRRSRVKRYAFKRVYLRREYHMIWYKVQRRLRYLQDDA